MSSSRPQVRWIAALSLLAFAPTALAAEHQDPGVSLRLGKTTASVSTSGGRVRVSVSTPPSGREARAGNAARARWQRMVVSRSEALSKYQEARAMQAEIKRANAAQRRR
jgi:hypothetical protein